MGMQGDFYQLLKEQGYQFGASAGSRRGSGAHDGHDDSRLQVS